jgi:hypothetical protein
MTLTARAESSVSTQLQQCQRLARVLTITQDMLSHADAGEWQRVADLERERRDDLSACFTESVSLVDSALIGEALAALLTLNEELMAKLKTAKSSVMESGIQFSRNRSAVGSYHEMQVTR